MLDFSPLFVIVCRNLDWDSILDADAEKELTRLCRSGSREAYCKLVNAYSGRVFAICLAMLGHREDAADAAQQVFLKGFTGIYHLRDSKRFGPWIARIARNLCTDFIRGRSREAQLCYQPQKPEPPQDSLWRDEPDKYFGLHRALEKLPGDYRTVLMLYYFDGRAINSVAQTLGINGSAVYTRLSRARKKLRELLEMHGDTL
jgi:RNA polymerase sigma-70 factor (ECF subfamily)